MLYNEQEEEELEADLTRLQEAYLGLLVFILLDGILISPRWR